MYLANILTKEARGALACSADFKCFRFWHCSVTHL